MDQRVEEPNGEDLARIETQREWMRGHFAPDARQKYGLQQEKLRLLQAILDAGWIERSDTAKRQCLGITLGDALGQELGMEWVMIDDENGRDPALRLPGTSVILFPLTTISKRIERGERVDVADLFKGVTEQAREMRANRAFSGTEAGPRLHDSGSRRTDRARLSILHEEICTRRFHC